MDKAIAGEMPWTLILKDPLANSFIAPGTEEAEATQNDPSLEIRDYDRSEEEDAEYGIDHLKTHGTGYDADLQAEHALSTEE